MFRQVHRTFTLIELLVVIAILSLLMSILLPTLRAARQRARELKCQVNLRQLALGINMYTGEWNGCLPGNCFDYFRDWLGTANYEAGNSLHVESAPEKGTLFKYVGQQSQVYFCPNHEHFMEDHSTTLRRYSYTIPLALTGAPTNIVRRCLIEIEPETEQGDWQHATLSRMLPILVEEDVHYYLEYVRDGGWSNDDSITRRHAENRGNLAFIDGHVESTAFPQEPIRMTAFHVFLELVDDRIVSLRHYADPLDPTGYVRMGFLQLRAPSERGGK